MSRRDQGRRWLRGVALLLVAVMAATAFVGWLGTIIGIAIGVPFLLMGLEDISPEKPQSALPAAKPTLPMTPQLRLSAPAGVCALCLRPADLLFSTARLAACAYCVESVSVSTPIDVDEQHDALWEIVRSLRPDERFTDPLAVVALVLDGRFDPRRVAAGMRDKLFDDDWRIHLRAWHFGLLAAAPPEARPEADAWAALARAVRKEDGLCCNVCGACNEALHVHHIIPLSEGGSNDPRNLVTLCYICHRAQHPTMLFSRPDLAKA